MGVWEALRYLDSRGIIVLTVHDEIVIECMADKALSVAKLCSHMTDDILPIKLPVEVSIGPNWADQLPFEGV